MFYAINNKCHFDSLSYVVGAILSDGCIYKSKFNNPYSKTVIPRTTWTIELAVRDIEFAQEFLEKLLKILKRPEKRTNKLYIHINENVKYYRVCVRNKGFGDWFSSLTQKEISKLVLEYPKEFLRAFYNAEGNLSQTGIRIFNTNKELINLIGKCLKCIGIEYKTRITRKSNKRFKTPHGIFHSKTLYQVSICKKSYIQQFLKCVGSSIPRKMPTTHNDNNEILISYYAI